MTVLPTMAPAMSEHRWFAQLNLRLSLGAQGTHLSRCRHNGPLYVQKPFYPEGRDHAHLYILHPPGGLVSGDELTINIDVEPGAGGLVTTPGAARVYRARKKQPLQRQHIQITMGPDASLEWFPLETIVYNGAWVELETDIHLHAHSRFIGWEIQCFGLPARDEPFTQGYFQQSYRVLREGQPIFIDRLMINDSNRKAFLEGSAGMQHNAVSGFFIVSPCTDMVRSKTDHETIIATLRDSLADLGMSQYAAISHMGDCYIGRYLGNSAEQAREIFMQWWQILRPKMLGRKACAPRIWST